MSLKLSNPIYYPPLDPWLTIVHRDDDLLVLDKPSGLLSVPGRDPALSDSLMTRVQKQFPKALMINRLDKDTSGIVLMSLNRKAHAAIAAQFEKRETRKSYVAIVWARWRAKKAKWTCRWRSTPTTSPATGWTMKMASRRKAFGASWSDCRFPRRGWRLRPLPAAPTNCVCI